MKSPFVDGRLTSLFDGKQVLMDNARCSAIGRPSVVGDSEVER